jgi:hypothetical protein
VIVAVRGHHEQLGGWKKAYREIASQPVNGGAPLPPWEEVIHARWNTERVLPWTHLGGGLPKATLISHNAASQMGNLAAE